jgi:hypothetical protein
MQTFDSGFWRTSSAASQASATHGFKGLHGSPQHRADQLVRNTVLADLGESAGSGHGIQGVAAAIQKVLSGQDVTGTDAADDVLKKIEASLHKAAQKLADRGVDAKTIDATIDRFRDQLAKALDGMIGSGSGGTDAPTNTPSPPTTSVSTFVAHEVRKERASLELVTAEGDRVSLRFRSKEVVTASAAQATTADGTTTTAANTTLISRGSLQVEVDGDLNEDEIAAIHDLIDKAYVVATRFFSGDVQAAFSAADALDVDSDQIAAYRLDMTYSRKVSAAYEYAGASLPASPQPTTSGSSPVGSASPGASTSSADTSDATHTATDANTPDTAAIDETSSSSTDTSPANPPTSARQTIVAFINDALSKLGSVKNVGNLSFSMQVKTSVLVTAIETVQPKQPTGEANQAAASNTQLLSDSLQKITAA